MRILFGMPEKTARGGINACEPPFIDALEARGVGVREIVTAYNYGPNVTLSQRVAAVRQTTRNLVAEVEANEFDLVHLNSALDRNALLRDGFILYHLARKNPKIFLKFHGSDLEMVQTAGFTMTRLLRFVISKVAALGVLSTEEGKVLREFGAPADKVFVVKNVVDGSVFPPVEKSADVPFKLVFASRLIPTKGLAETVEAIAIATKKGCKVMLDVYGDGEARAAAEEFVGAHKLGEIVRFHGHVSEEDVARGYAAADALVFPTFHNEGFPMVVFSAVRAGLPIITTRIRAAADYLKDRENCMFCGGQNAESVARRIVELVENTELRKRMAANNLTLGEKFTAAAVVPEYIEIYERLAAKN